jgi:acyl-CoA reductase-like NAD-dependent aldehyde dehydrogenase
VAPRLLIAGELRESRDAFPVVNPATEEVVASAPAADAAALGAALDAAVSAKDAWAADETARREALRAAADRLLGAADELARMLTLEQGKPLREARGEVRMMARWLDHFAELDLGEPGVVRDDGRCLVEVRREPVGVVAAITPWNFPLALAAWKLAPALLAGNVVVLKPSPLTPLSTLMAGELLADVVPPGVLSVLAGPEPLGRLLVEHPAVDKVSFTGSIAVGREVAVAAARRLRRDTLELGGNDAAIILDDVDAATVAPQLVACAFVNCGQVCSAIKRLYVPRARMGELIEAIADAAAQLTIGDGLDPATRVGPLVSEAQRERVEALVADALAGGARLHAGGSRLPRRGWFHELTVLETEDPALRVVAEEQFGPVLPVLPFDRVEDAVRLANATRFGLGGSVWGADEERARAIALELECGTVWVNTHVTVHPEQPFGGWKDSGAGLENGPWGLDEFTRVRAVHAGRAG